MARIVCKLQETPFHRSEADVKRSVMDYLKRRGIFALRMNVGSFAGEYKGRKRFVQFGMKGCADILAIRPLSDTWTSHHVVWVELKRPGGKQSPAQSEFQKLVEAEGHRYVIVHSAEELSKCL